MGRNFRVISRWELISQICSSCRFKSGKSDVLIPSRADAFILTVVLNMTVIKVQ